MKRGKELTRLEKTFAILLILYFIVILTILFLFNFLPLDREIALKFYDISQFVLPALVAASGIASYRANK
jgi:hypothetical protein